MNNNDPSVHKMVKSDSNHLADIKCDSSFKFTEGLTLETLWVFVDALHFNYNGEPRVVRLVLVSFKLQVENHGLYV